MNVQSLNCQPIKPVYGSVSASKPAFRATAQETVDDLNELKRTVGFDNDTKKKGLMGVAKGALMASIAWFTLIAAAPKTIQILSGATKKVLNMSIIKKPALFIKDQAVKLGGKIKDAFKNVDGKTTKGKVMNAIAAPVLFVKQKAFDPIAKYTLNFIEKNKIDAPWLKNACVKFLAGTSALMAFVETTGLTEPVKEAVKEVKPVAEEEQIDGDIE